MKTKTAMTSRERFLAAARGLPVDRMPIYYWLNPHGCCKLIAQYKPYDGLFWNIAGRFMWNRFHNSGEMNAPYLWRFLPLGMDFFVFNTAAEYAFQLGSDMGMFQHSTPYRFAKFGIENWRFVTKDVYGTGRSIGSGIYEDMHEPPIKKVEDLRTYRFPDLKDASRYNIIRKMRKKYPDKCLASAVWGAFDFPEQSLFGTERYLTMLVDYPEEMQDFLTRWTDNEIDIIRRSVKAGADAIFILDDYGYNNRTFLSPRMWKKMIYPHLKRIIDESHEAGAITILHSCGYQMTLLDYYVEAGLDMLQAFQSLAGNDLTSAYAKYGDKLTFITGIDTQRGESMGSQEFQQDILTAYRIGREKNRFVLGTTHEMQFTMPDANAKMIFDTVADIHAGRY
jgi:uroporphyrinogen decarboxylase